MKQSNKIILLAVAGIATIVLVADFILFLAAESISGTVFGVTALISAPLSIVPLMFLIAPDEMRKQFDNANIAKQGFLPRTRESTLFELASALILVCSWVIVLALHNKEFHILLITTVAVMALLVTAYFTDKWTLGMVAANNMQQLQTGARFKRILAVETALYGLLTVCPGINQTFVNWTFLLIAVFSCVWFITANLLGKRS